MFRNVLSIAAASLLLSTGVLTAVSSTKQKTDTTQQQIAHAKTKAAKYQNNYGLNSFNVHQLKDDPRQIYNDIKNVHLYVAGTTNPDVTNPQTLAAIKSSLKTANSKLTTADMQYITDRAVDLSSKLNRTNYTAFYCIVTEGTAQYVKTIYVKLGQATIPAINLYNPVYGVNQYNAQSSYLDDIFLKGLNYDAATKTVTFSSSKLTGQDLTDYQNQMAPTNNIQPGLVLLNRYLHNAFLIYNPTGYIPSRSQLTSGVHTDDRQTVIEVNPQIQAKNGSDIGDYLNFNLHWDGFSLTLKKKLINDIIVSFLMKVINVSLEGAVFKLFDSIADYVSKITRWVVEYITQIATEFNLDVDSVSAELPGVGEIIDAVISVVTVLIVSSAIKAVLNIIEDTLTNKLLKSYVKEHNPKLPFDFLQGAYAFQLPKQTSSLMAYTLTFNVRLSSLVENNFVSSTTRSDPGVTLPHVLQPSEIKNTSLNTTSFISGTANDFTIAANSEDLSTLCRLLNDKLSNTSVLFNDIEWTTPDELILAQKIPLNVFYKISGQPQVWGVPEGYMAMIHVEKVNGQYQVVWSNLATAAEQKSLPEADNGMLNTSFIGESAVTNVLINERIYSELMSRFVWVKQNWGVISQSSYSRGCKSWQAYFEKYVIKGSINSVNINLTNLETIMQDLSSVFSNNVKMAHNLNTVISPTQLFNIYFNNQTQKITIQHN